MSILIALLPFLVFALVEQLAGVLAGVISGAAMALSLCMRDWLGSRRRSGVLEMTSLTLFGALLAYALSVFPALSTLIARVVSDGGLLLVMLLSLLLGRPFTLSYAESGLRLADLLSPRFIRSHYTVSGIWTLALLVIVSADVMALVWPPVAVASAAVVASAAFASSCFTLRHAASLRA